MRLGAASLAFATGIALAAPGAAQEAPATRPPDFAIDHVGCAVDEATFEAASA